MLTGGRSNEINMKTALGFAKVHHVSGWWKKQQCTIYISSHSIHHPNQPVSSVSDPLCLVPTPMSQPSTLFYAFLSSSLSLSPSSSLPHSSPPGSSAQWCTKTEIFSVNACNSWGLCSWVLSWWLGNIFLCWNLLGHRMVNPQGPLHSEFPAAPTPFLLQSISMFAYLAMLVLHSSWEITKDVIDSNFNLSSTLVNDV